MFRTNIFKALCSGIFLLTFVSSAFSVTLDKSVREQKRKEQLDTMQKDFLWWPSDAKPAPVKDEQMGGYWWWPTAPGEAKPWGNRGYIYVYKIIYDYKAEDEEEGTVKAPEVTLQAPELKPSLLVKKIIRNVKIYFDYNKADLRDDHVAILQSAVKTLERNPQADILITGNCDARGSTEYNLKLGKKRGEAVKEFMLKQGIPEERVRIISRGKLDAVAHISDLVGMQKERNAQFMIAEVEEVMIPDPEQLEAQGDVKATDDGNYLLEQKENVETQVQVSTKEYVIKKNDSLWKIAQEQLGSGHRWKYLYEMNKDRIKNPNRLKAGVKIIIPVE